MKQSSIVFIVFFLLIAMSLAGMEFHSAAGGGPWGDPETWGDFGGHTPGPDDDVFISASSVVVGGGICRNLTIEYFGGLPGRLVGEFAYLSECQVRGDFVCNGYLLPGAGGGTYNLEVWGNITITNNCEPTELHLTGSSPTVSDRVSFFQETGAKFFTSVTVSPTFPGLKLLSSLNMDSRDAYHSLGTINGAELLLCGQNVTQTRLLNCRFPMADGCFSGTIENCKLSNVESFIPLSNLGSTELLNNQCVFHDVFTNLGTFNGPISMTGILVIQDLVNNGIVQPGWNATLNIFCNGSITNNHTLVSDVVFTADNTHFWTEGAGSQTIGNYVNMSDQLILQSDFTMASLGNFSLGTIYLNGHWLVGANLYDGNIHGQGGVLSGCQLGTLTTVGEIYLANYTQLMDSNVVFSGTTGVNGTLAGAISSSCHLEVPGMLYNYGIITPGWSGTFSIHCQQGFSNHGSTTADLISFSGSENQYLNWSAGSVFAFNLLNQSAQLVLMGDSDINANNCVWTLHNSSVDNHIKLANLSLFDSQISGVAGLKLDNVIFGNVQFNLPVTVLNNGCVLSGSANSFNAQLYLQGNLAGTTSGLENLHCFSDVFLEGGSVTNGWSGQLNFYLHAGLSVNAGEVLNAQTIFTGADEHLLSMAETGVQIGSSLVLEDGANLTLASDLRVLYHTLLTLNNYTLHLNGHRISNAYLLGGMVSGGRINSCYLEEIQLSNITLEVEVVLQSTSCQAWGELVNNGQFFSAEWSTCSMEVWGNVTNNGAFNPGYCGNLIMNCHGSVLNGGVWNASTNLLGNSARSLSLVTPSLPIVVAEGSIFQLTDANTLSAFTVSQNAQVKVAENATLQMEGEGSFYTANQSGFGSFVNMGVFTNSRNVESTAVMDYYALKLIPSAELAADYDNLEVIHSYGAFPPELPNSYPELWTITPTGQSQLQYGSLTFTHCPDPYLRVMEESLELWFNPLGMGSWTLYTGSYSYSTQQHSFTADSIPIGGEYVFVVGTLAAPANLSLFLVDTPDGIRPGLNWTAVPGASHYRILCSETPSGPWSFIGTSHTTQWLDNTVADRRFYQVLARWGAE